MTVITDRDVVESVADALQFISYYHPTDFVQAVHRAYEMEQSQAAKDAIAQILINSRMCAMGKRPICQDTGIVTVFVDIGMEVRWDTSKPLEDLINEGVSLAYLHPDNKLRASILEDPAGARKNTKDNTPAVIHTRMSRAIRSIFVLRRGRWLGEQIKAAMLNPSDSIVDWVGDGTTTARVVSTRHVGYRLVAPRRRWSWPKNH